LRLLLRACITVRERLQLPDAHKDKLIAITDLWREKLALDSAFLSAIYSDRLLSLAGVETEMEEITGSVTLEARETRRQYLLAVQVRGWEVDRRCTVAICNACDHGSVRLLSTGTGVCIMCVPVCPSCSVCMQENPIHERKAVTEGVQHILAILRKASDGMRRIRENIRQEMANKYGEREASYKEAKAAIEDEEDALLKEVRAACSAAARAGAWRPP
jgi:hypothetical protein